MFNKIKLPAIAMALAFLTAPLTACNTVEGIGKDVEHAGERIEDSAK